MNCKALEDFKVYVQNCSIDELLTLFNADDIQDITISSTPLEDIIKDIYRGENE